MLLLGITNDDHVLINFKYAVCICLHDPGGKETIIMLYPEVCWLKLQMSCPDCGRPLGVGLCPGCRTVGRIKNLWSRQVKWGDDSEGLTILRSCAGCLLDLVETRGSGVPAPLGSTPKAPGVAKQSGAAPAVAPAKEAEKRSPQVASKAAPATREGSEKVRAEKEPDKRPLEEEDSEGEESSTIEEDTEVPAEDNSKKEDKRPLEEEPKKKEAKTGEDERWHRPFQRGCLSAPLGLKPLPIQLSPRDGDFQGNKERKRSRREEDAERAEDRAKRSEDTGRDERERRSSGADGERARPRSPPYPPAHRAGGEVDRDRKKKKKKKHKKKEHKSKGVKKRQRGYYYQDNKPNAGGSSQWRPRHERR